MRKVVGWVLIVFWFWFFYGVGFFCLFGQFVWWWFFVPKLLLILYPFSISMIQVIQQQLQRLELPGATVAVPELYFLYAPPRNTYLQGKEKQWGDVKNEPSQSILPLGWQDGQFFGFFHIIWCKDPKSFFMVTVIIP